MKEHLKDECCRSSSFSHEERMLNLKWDEVNVTNWDADED